MAVERSAAAGLPGSSRAFAGAGGVERHATRGPRKYPFRLNMYREPPVHEVTVEQFETWAIDRLRGETSLSCRRGQYPYGAESAAC